jgi:N-acetylmuramoyl-L-alanine amidase
MMFKKIIYILLIFLLPLIAVQLDSDTYAATNNTSGPQQLLAKADQSRKSLLNSATKMNLRQNWLKCLSKYQDIYEKYPKSDQAPWALYHSAGLYRRLYQYSSLDEDLDKSLSLCQKLADEYRDHRLADDAQYQRGDIYYREKNDPTQAYVEFLKLDLNFPSGDMRPKGKAIMDELSAALGKGEEIKQETPGSSSNGLVTIKNIRSWSTATYTRVVIDSDTPVKYTSNLLKEDKTINKPRRLYIDLENSRVTSEIVSPIKDGLLQAARAGQYNKNTVRVVLDIDNIGDYKIFSLYDPFRIVIDVQGTTSAVKETGKQASSSSSASNTRTARKGIYKPDGADENVSLAGQLGLTVKRIVIDPGHGGKDPGTDLGGIQEKDITLDMAKKLAAKIKEIVGCDVLLTRDKDVAIPLEERTAFANENKADLFISIHVNAHKQSSVYGLETYFLNMATDERAVMVAARENATSEKNISDLQSILNDLMLNTKISESSKLAYKVQNGMMSNIKKTYKVRKDLGVKQAPFYVLIGAEMPAVLIETGFITNPTEKKRLLNDSYKKLLTDGITSGINSYIKSIEPAAYDNTGG